MAASWARTSREASDACAARSRVTSRVTPSVDSDPVVDVHLSHGPASSFLLTTVTDDMHPHGDARSIVPYEMCASRIGLAFLLFATSDEGGGGGRSRSASHESATILSFHRIGSDPPHQRTTVVDDEPTIAPCLLLALSLICNHLSLSAFLLFARDAHAHCRFCFAVAAHHSFLFVCVHLACIAMAAVGIWREEHLRACVPSSGVCILSFLRASWHLVVVYDAWGVGREGAGPRGGARTVRYNVPATAEPPRGRRERATIIPVHGERTLACHGRDQRDGQAAKHLNPPSIEHRDNTIIITTIISIRCRDPIVTRVHCLAPVVVPLRGRSVVISLARLRLRPSRAWPACAFRKSTRRAGKARASGRAVAWRCVDSAWADAADGEALLDRAGRGKRGWKRTWRAGELDGDADDEGEEGGKEERRGDGSVVVIWSRTKKSGKDAGMAGGFVETKKPLSTLAWVRSIVARGSANRDARPTATSFLETQ